MRKGFGLELGYSSSKWYMEVKLKALKCPPVEAVYIIDEHNDFTFGSSPKCTFTVSDDDTVAPFHFQIKVEPPVVWLIDCGSALGVEVKHYLMHWFSVGGSLEKVSGIDSLYHFTEALCDKDYIRVGEHLFLLTIDMPCVCIECGAELKSLQKAMSRFVGDIFYCILCRTPEDGAWEGCEELFDYFESIKPLFVCKNKERLHDFLNGHRARELWLKGVFNNKDYSYTPPDCRKILVEYQELYRKYLHLP